MKDVVVCVLNLRQLQFFLSEIDAAYGDVLNHTEVRWLTPSPVWKCFFSALTLEIEMFTNKKCEVMVELNEEKWLCVLALLWISVTTERTYIRNFKVNRNIFLIGAVRMFETKLKEFRNCWKMLNCVTCHCDFLHTNGSVSVLFPMFHAIEMIDDEIP
jgi:hypothetical protein